MDLQELSDRQEITDLITRFTLAIDTRSFADLRLVFTQDAVLDYSSAGGPTGSSDVVVPWLERALGGFDRFQHVVGQIAIDLQGDTAQATAYFTSPRVVVIDPEGTEKVREVGGYHHHDLVRTPAGWRSRGFVDDRVWSRRN
jgi:hypothetical protein